MIRKDKSMLPDDEKADPFQSKRQIKTIRIYNQLDVPITVRATIEKARDIIESLHIKRDYNDVHKSENSSKQDKLNKNMGKKVLDNTNDQQHLKHDVKEINTSIDTKAQKNNETANKSSNISSSSTDNQSSKDVNVDISASKSSSNSNEKSDSSSSRDKHATEVGASYGVASVNVKHENEKERSKSSLSKNASSKNMSGSSAVGYKSTSQDKAQNNVSNSHESVNKNLDENNQSTQNKIYTDNKDEMKHKTGINNDISINSEIKDNKEYTSSISDNKQRKFEADVNYANNEIDQLTSSEVRVDSDSSHLFSFEVNKSTSLIFLSIDINDEKWMVSMGYDTGSYVVHKNKTNRPRFDPLTVELQQKLDLNVTAELEQTMSTSSLSAKNKEILNNWDEDEVADYIKYLSRKHGESSIPSAIGDILEDNEINGQALYKCTKQDLKKMVKKVDKQYVRGVNYIYSELQKVKNGDIALPTLDELYPKVISDWDSNTVQMFIGTINDGKYYQYINYFNKVDGKYLINDVKNENDLDKIHKFESLAVRLEIWKKLNEIKQNRNIPEKEQIAKQFEAIKEKIRKEEEEKKEPVIAKPKKKKLNLQPGKVHTVEQLQNGISVGKRHRTMMVIGATGTGKTTLLNSMTNYLWGIEFSDKFRMKLITEQLKKHGQAESVTDDVTAYYLDPPELEYQLTVIDTPGFGDTRGLEQDQKITRKIKKFFETKIQEIDAICFVIRAPQARLTATQKYIFAQVLGIFGNDIKDNILILMTFADGKKPPALEALKAGDVPYNKAFKLNNSAFDLPEEGEDDMFAEMFWKMGMKSFESLFIAIDKLNTKSLQLTKQVLTRREELENYIESVQPMIRSGHTVLEKLRHQIIVIQKFGDLINENKDFTYQEVVNKARRIDNNGDFNTTTCMECNYTCHRSCAFKDNGDKERCSAMDRSTGNCRNCPNNCYWMKHKNMPYTVEWYPETVTKESKSLRDKYYDANNQKSAEEQIMVGTVTELSNVEENLNALINSVRECLNELSSIALRPNVLSQHDYIDKLIQSEESERNPGWQKRVGSLKELKKKQDMLGKLNSGQYNPWKQYDDVQQFINKNSTVKQGVKKKSHKQKQDQGKNKKQSAAWYNPSTWFSKS